jgi:hypothetical protein
VVPLHSHINSDCILPTSFPNIHSNIIPAYAYFFLDFFLVVSFLQVFLHWNSVRVSYHLVVLKFRHHLRVGATDCNTKLQLKILYDHIYIVKRSIAFICPMENYLRFYFERHSSWTG